MALNASQHKAFREVALPAAVAKKMGVIAMKTTRGLVGTGDNKASARELLAYAWDLPVAVAIVGMETIEQLNENIQLAQDYKPGKINTTSLASRLSRTATDEQVAWAMPGYQTRPSEPSIRETGEACLARLARFCSRRESATAARCERTRSTSPSGPRKKPTRMVSGGSPTARFLAPR
jgi:PII-like signaling protein